MKPIVIYGSGRSLLGHTEKQWEELRGYDSVGFNWFILQKWLEPTYMVVGDTRPIKNLGMDSSKYEVGYERYADEADRPLYDKTKFYCLERHKINLEYIRRPVELFDVPHKNWDSSATIHTLYLMIKLGYTEIIYAGVDLYDNRYFYIDKNEVRVVSGGKKQKWFSRKVKDGHPVNRKLYRIFDSHPECFENVNIYSYNPKSLLLKRKEIKQW